MDTCILSADQTRSLTPTSLTNPRPPGSMVQWQTKSCRHLPISLLHALKGWAANETTSLQRMTGGHTVSSLFYLSNPKKGWRSEPLFFCFRWVRHITDPYGYPINSNAKPMGFGYWGSRHPGTIVAPGWKQVHNPWCDVVGCEVGWQSAEGICVAQDPALIG